MNKFVVYIGAAIDQANGSPDDQYNELKKIVTEALGDENFVGYSPLHAFFGADKTRSRKTNQFVVRVNEEALLCADLAVFVWSDSPSFGVPLEITHCKEYKIPFVIWDRSTKKLPGIYLQHSVDAIADNACMVSSREEVINSIKHLMSPRQERLEKSNVEEPIAKHPSHNNGSGRTVGGQLGQNTNSPTT